MKFKKIFFGIASLILGVVICGLNAVVVNAIKITNEEGKICRSKSFSDNTICFETIEYSPEISTRHANGETIYRKKVTVKREYKRADSLEILTGCTLALTFKYDKESSVKCEFSVLEQNKKDYYLKPLIEILPEEKITTGSVKYNLYQKNILESYDYISDGHIDVFCSSVGELGINSNI